MTTKCNDAHTYAFMYVLASESGLGGESVWNKREYALCDVRRKFMEANLRSDINDVYVKRSIAGMKTWCKYNKRFSDLSVSQISCGSGHGVALTRSGRVLTWGSNDSGQLGIGKREYRDSSKLQYLNLTGNAVSVSAGFGHSMCLLSDSTVLTWGLNSHGQLGTEDHSPRYYPTTISTSCLDKLDFIECGPLFSLIGNNDGYIAASGKLKTSDKVILTSSFTVIMKPPTFQHPRGILTEVSVSDNIIACKYMACITSLYPTLFVGSTAPNRRISITIEGVLGECGWKVGLIGSDGCVLILRNLNRAFISPYKCVLEVPLEEPLVFGRCAISVTMIPMNHELPSLEQPFMHVFSDEVVKFTSEDSEYHVDCFLSDPTPHQLAIPVYTDIPNTRLIIEIEKKELHQSAQILVSSGRISDNVLYIDLQDMCASRGSIGSYKLQIFPNRQSIPFKACISIHTYQIYEVRMCYSRSVIQKISFRIQCNVLPKKLHNRESILIRIGTLIEVESRSYVILRHQECCVEILFMPELVAPQNKISISLDAGNSWTTHILPPPPY